MTVVVTCTPAAIYRHRLLMVEKALRESPNPDRFDMAFVIHECGTPGCAFGHYVSRTDLQSAFRVMHSQRYDSEWIDGRRACYFDRSVGEHFGLSQREQGDLFDGDGCGDAVTAVQAADWIRGFVERKYPQWIV